jgi:hypothetical protein
MTRVRNALAGNGPSNTLAFILAAHFYITLVLVECLVLVQKVITITLWHRCKGEKVTIMPVGGTAWCSHLAQHTGRVAWDYISLLAHQTVGKN